MALSASTQSRLLNWKFEQALGQMQDDRTRHTFAGTPVPTDDEESTVLALSDAFGDCGYFEGAVASIVRGCVAWLLGQPLDAPDEWLPDGMKKKAEAEAAPKTAHLSGWWQPWYPA